MRVKTEQTRQRIVDAAYQCFWRSGFTRTSIDDIAERAKLTKKRSTLTIRARTTSWRPSLFITMISRISG